jgi:uncharacterized protein (TIGR00369 family)
MEVLPVYRASFFVNQRRKDGLRLKMLYDNNMVYCNMNIDTRFEGYHGVVHGGILFGILDVIIWYAIFMETKKICMTRKTDMDFFKPVLSNVTYKACGKLLRVEERDYWATAWIEDPSGDRCSQVTALFRESKNLDYNDFVKNLEFTDTSPEMKEFFLSVAKQG